MLLLRALARDSRERMYVYMYVFVYFIIIIQDCTYPHAARKKEATAVPVAAKRRERYLNVLLSNNLSSPVVSQDMADRRGGPGARTRVSLASHR